MSSVATASRPPMKRRAGWRVNVTARAIKESEWPARSWPGSSDGHFLAQLPAFSGIVRHYCLPMKKSGLDFGKYPSHRSIILVLPLKHNLIADFPCAEGVQESIHRADVRHAPPVRLCFGKANRGSDTNHAGRFFGCRW